MSTVVVGAGPAGLAAARRLQEQGEDVVILEARDCIGGRTRSLRDVLRHGQPADLGASFIDIGQDLLLQICDEFGLELTPRLSLSPREPDGTFTAGSVLRNRLILDGELVSDHESAALADEVSTAVAQVPPSPDETAPAWAARAGLSHRARQAFLAQTAFIPTTAPWRVQMGILSPPMIGKLCWMLADGTDSIALAIAEGLDIRLEQPVRLIAHDRIGFTVTTDRETFSASHVIVATPPPTVLRIGFDPALPVWKTDALLSIPMSQGGKVIAQYTHGDEIVRRIEHAVLCDGPVGFVWPRPIGPENTIVLLGLIRDRHDGALRSEERIFTALDDIVRTVVGDGPRRLAGVLRDWTAEEWSRGVVSLPFADTPQMTSLLAQRIGRLHFAGEHTDDTFATGMEGALRSGLRVADEVLSARTANRPVGHR
jgi:monoamine oxidase